ncbi:hypothetical protein TrLO_g3875 [Triparma laevis f. longispina]|uniref:Secreted protein n=1 Tax=Triparma laevis f. longispina TaxID=1714387 RepID=A0A9W7EAW5_9STRA|nr:hypothetical protein TrLO_g3875 [Triparma laevis f. longispina]
MFDKVILALAMITHVRLLLPQRLQRTRNAVFANDSCNCYTRPNGRRHLGRTRLAVPRNCPIGNDWVSVSTAANEVHTLTELTNKGVFDSKTSSSACFDGYDRIDLRRVPPTAMIVMVKKH